jgi:hypothetical protein
MSPNPKRALYSFSLTENLENHKELADQDLLPVGPWSEY